jgi:molecular chaperone DnaK (HSP70)
MSAERRSSARLLCALGVDLGTTNSTIAEASLAQDGRRAPSSQRS